MAETTEKRTPHSSTWLTRSLVSQYALLVILTALPFLTSLRYQFVYDDDVQIVNNTAIRSWDSVPDYFTSTSFGVFDPTAASNLHYRPIFYLWLRINDALSGVHPFGWHLTALCIHVAVTVLVFHLLLWHFGDSWIARTAALIFGVWPIHIESVVWVSGATDAVAALFLLISLLLWLRRNRSSHSGTQIASLACFAAALLTKETAIVFPAIILVYAAIAHVDKSRIVAPIGRRTARAIKDVSPFAAVALLYLTARYAVLRHLPPFPHWISTRDAALSAPLTLLFYLRHLVWPFRLSLFYSLPVATSIRSIMFWLPMLVLTVFVVAVVHWWGRTHASAIPVAFSWVVFPLLLVLNISLLQRDDTVHDRYLYLSSIGLAIFIGVLLATPFPARVNSCWFAWRTPIAAAVIFVLAIATFVQAAPWRDNLSLYKRAVDVSPSNTIARNNVASELTKRDQLDQARSILESVVRDRPDYWLANYNLGYLNYRLKNFDAAETYLRRAIALNPSDADQRAYLGLVYFHESRFSDAADELRKAIAIKPAGPGYHITLALVLAQLQDLGAARAECLEELAFHPDSAAAQTELALIEQRLANSK